MRTNSRKYRLKGQRRSNIKTFLSTGTQRIASFRTSTISKPITMNYLKTSGSPKLLVNLQLIKSSLRIRWSRIKLKHRLLASMGNSGEERNLSTTIPISRNKLRIILSKSRIRILQWRYKRVNHIIWLIRECLWMKRPLKSWNKYPSNLERSLKMSRKRKRHKKIVRPNTKE